MASFTTEDLVVQSAPAAMERKQCRRRVSPEAGRALEILGHAIEYVTDEFVHAGGSFSAHSA